ncbi:DUF72 domain-containing protein [Coralloluteibacterium thermophilus]|uniref:DUF72 domain-containing protein n=1 Tax=Coralloluteibacterium thermophilum TaxID=2707049 RepID=A0ABV9NN94_9GAMM
MDTRPADLFASAAPAAARRIRVGIGGWTFAPWRDNFYPKGLVQRRELEYASRRLSAIEINGTFHGPQKPETFARWASDVPDGFVFALKAPKAVVGRSRWAPAADAAARFLAGGPAELGDRLGPVLWQFQAGHRFDPDDLDGFLAALPRTTGGLPLRHVLEVRHPSFACADYLALARRHGVATVYTDAAAFPNIADLTADFAYARLMRSREHEALGYTAAELDAWTGHARTWAEGGTPAGLPRIGDGDAGAGAPREVFVFFISAAKARNPAAAQALLARLSEDA